MFPFLVDFESRLQNVVVVKIDATDGDDIHSNSPPSLHYKIEKGDPQSFFRIDQHTGGYHCGLEIHSAQKLVCRRSCWCWSSIWPRRRWECTRPIRHRREEMPPERVRRVCALDGGGSLVGGVIGCDWSTRSRFLM